jgi:hypothetical protein
VWLLVLGAKNPNGRVVAINEEDAVSGVCWPGLRGEGKGSRGKMLGSGLEGSYGLLKR